MPVIRQLIHLDDNENAGHIRNSLGFFIQHQALNVLVRVDLRRNGKWFMSFNTKMIEYCFYTNATFTVIVLTVNQKDIGNFVKNTLIIVSII